MLPPLISATPEVQLPTLTYQKCTSDESAIKPGGAHPAQICTQPPSSSGQAAPFHVIQNPRLFPFSKLYFPAQDLIQSMALNPFNFFFYPKQLQPCISCRASFRRSPVQVNSAFICLIGLISNCVPTQLFVSVLEMQHRHKDTRLKLNLEMLISAAVPGNSVATLHN